jgi:hypothetical protein
MADIRNELEKYLAEPVEVVCSDILSFWQNKSSTYPSVSKMASDFLCIQLSSVASEFAFSGSGRVMDDYRSRLSGDTLEMLMQTRSWLQALGVQDHNNFSGEEEL